jgi:hypothetical protein
VNNLEDNKYLVVLLGFEPKTLVSKTSMISISLQDH